MYHRIICMGNIRHKWVPPCWIFSVATLAYDDKVMNYNSYTQLIHLNEENIIQTIYFISTIFIKTEI